MQLVPLFLLLVTGCMPPGTDGFGGGGSKNRPDGGDDSAAGDDTEAADDTGMSSNRPDGWPDPLDEDGPSITDLQGEFDEYPNVGDVLEVSFAYWDGQGDVKNGSLVITVNDGHDYVDALFQASIAGNMNGSCWVADGRVYFALQDVYDSRSYDLSVMITDRNNHRSNVLEGTLSR